jgi:hypothetical protein
MGTTSLQAPCSAGPAVALTSTGGRRNAAPSKSGYPGQVWNPSSGATLASWTRRLAMAQRTTDHETIRKWAEARDGHPTKVKGTGGPEDVGLLRLDFGKPEENLEAISWEEFFDQFDESELALLYEDEPGNRFNKIVSR